MIAALKAVSYAYPRAARPSLQNISLDIPRGQLLGIIGPSKAGKSTLCYLLAGMIPHFYRGMLDGDVRILDEDLRETSLATLAGRVGLVVQNPFNQISGARFTVRDELAFGLENLGLLRDEMLARVEQTLSGFELTDLAERSPYTLSGGQQQRVAIASIVIMQPELLILDEPTSQLDPASTREIFALIHALVERRNTTVVLATHKLEWLAGVADQVVALADGAIIAHGSPREVLTDTGLAARGIGLTAFTETAQLAGTTGVNTTDPLPITLDEAVSFFSRA
jgi:energy-coupling factor transporter ATP-binding protein EcfA2